MKKIGIALGLSITLGLVGCFEKPNQEASSLEIETVENYETIEVDGRVVAKNKRDIYIDFPAEVVEIYANKGEIVSKGKTLLTLDFESYKEQIELKKKGISLYEIELKTLNDSLDPRLKSIVQLQQTKNIKEKQLDEANDPDFRNLYGQLELAEEELQIALEDYTVSKELWEAGVTAQKQVEQLEQQTKIKQKQTQGIGGEIEKLRAARQLEVDDLRSQIEVQQAQMKSTDKERQSKIETLMNQIEIANMDVEIMESKLDLPYLKGNELIVNGADWLVEEVGCEKGSRLEYIQGPILKVIDKNSLVVEVDIPEEYLEDVVVGTQVKVIPYFNEESFEMGVIEKLSEIVIESYGENVIKGEIKLETPVEWMKLGMGVDVEIIQSK